MAGKGARSVSVWDSDFQHYAILWCNLARYAPKKVCVILGQSQHILKKKTSTKCHDMVDIKAFVRAAGSIETIVTLNKLMIFKLV